jgi:hypothetical protein
MTMEDALDFLAVGLAYTEKQDEMAEDAAWLARFKRR